MKNEYIFFLSNIKTANIIRQTHNIKKEGVKYHLIFHK